MKERTIRGYYDKDNPNGKIIPSLDYGIDKHGNIIRKKAYLKLTKKERRKVRREIKERQAEKENNGKLEKV